jgi:hypothetical protein
MNVHVIRPPTEFQHRKSRFLFFKSLKAVYLIPQLTLMDSSANLEEGGQSYAFELLLHAASDNKRDDQATK